MTPSTTPAHTPLLTVTNRVSLDDRGQDEVYEFTAEGQRRFFGRDDTVCEIVIWSAHNGSALARVAGEIWRMDNQLWIRNLSNSHELGFEVPDEVAPAALLPRRDERARGPACSIPDPVATITAPDDCRLDVLQLHQPRPEIFTYGLEEPTVPRVPPVPDQLRKLATVLCEPLLLGHWMPASYSEVVARIGNLSRSTVRRQVGELCLIYTGASPQLAEQVEQRKRAAEDPSTFVRKGMIQRPVPSRELPTAELKVVRVHRLSLADYDEVARLLVKHHRITRDDLALLPEREGERT